MNIHLRPFAMQDAAAFAQAVNESLESLLPWMVWAHADYSEQNAREWFSFTEMQRNKGEADELGIYDDNGHLLGGAGLRYARDKSCLPAIGYWVRSSQQRKGIARQAVAYLAEQAFRCPEINTIEILAAETNLASRAVATASGAELIDTRYGLIILDSGPVNTAIYHLRRRHQAPQ
ncbi:GNAT family N-acetyltransferase [Winslowiella iniecta]|uniref:Ribosomal-protein-serine acetyltransferase n=1 Tax=Winslowiella iniecta TaxID=1560201 RepID=A0A0L7T1B8_9GAMM|nr:GNAT family N-acetyltransferase [Winslowiella iniecta]KOC89192.1 ribosomal-protein-serine acetyltransferase [Winslowiella iniecta]KOC93035.1 ribosomal-protein-serine acetyltransferase [Winslowiella iniecta]